MKTALVLLLFTAIATAHHGPQKGMHHENDHRIEVLSKKIAQQPSASLLTMRARVFIELGKNEEAKHDLEHALKIDESFTQAKSLLNKFK